MPGSAPDDINVGLDLKPRNSNLHRAVKAHAKVHLARIPVF